MLVIGHAKPVKLIKLRNGFCTLMQLCLIEDSARRTHSPACDLHGPIQACLSLSKVSKSCAVHTNAENVAGHKLVIGTVYTTEEPPCGMRGTDDIFILFC